MLRSPSARLPSTINKHQGQRNIQSRKKLSCEKSIVLSNGVSFQLIIDIRRTSKPDTSLNFLCCSQRWSWWESNLLDVHERSRKNSNFPEDIRSFPEDISTLCKWRAGNVHGAYQSVKDILGNRWLLATLPQGGCGLKRAACNSGIKTCKFLTYSSECPVFHARYLARSRSTPPLPL